MMESQTDATSMGEETLSLCTGNIPRSLDQMNSQNKVSEAYSKLDTTSSSSDVAEQLSPSLGAGGPVPQGGRGTSAI